MSYQLSLGSGSCPAKSTEIVLLWCICRCCPYGKNVDSPAFDNQVTLQLIDGARHDGLSVWEVHWVAQLVTLVRQRLIDGISCLMCMPATQSCLQLGGANETAHLAHPPWHGQGP